MAGKNSIKTIQRSLNRSRRRLAKPVCIPCVGTYERKRLLGFFGSNRRGDFNFDFNNDFLI
jgi:hypothetical protein